MTAPAPLAVDVDGTQIKADLFAMAMLRLARNAPVSSQEQALREFNVERLIPRSESDCR